MADNTNKLDKDEIKKLVLEAMEYRWNDFVGDTGYLPNDIELSNKKTSASFSPGHWANQVAEDVANEVLGIRSRKSSIQSSFVLTRLVKHLNSNHSIRNASSVPKEDDYHCFLGRGESVSHVIAKVCQVDDFTINNLVSSREDEDKVLVDKIYLEALIEESKNERLVSVMKRQLGQKVN